MTNAEVYKKVFGMNVDESMCPTSNCKNCPCVIRDIEGNTQCFAGSTYEWWNTQYKEV